MDSKRKKQGDRPGKRLLGKLLLTAVDAGDAENP